MTEQQKLKINKDIEKQKALDFRAEQERKKLLMLAKECDDILEDIYNYMEEFDQKYGGLCDAVS